MGDTGITVHQSLAEDKYKVWAFADTVRSAKEGHTHPASTCTPAVMPPDHRALLGSGENGDNDFGMGFGDLSYLHRDVRSPSSRCSPLVLCPAL